MQHESSPVNTNVDRNHYFKSRNFELAGKVASLPDSAWVGAFEISALSGIAATSIQKPTQRKSIGLPEPRVVGRINKWPLSVVRSWLQDGVEVVPAPAPTTQRGRGRPTMASRFGSAA